MTPSPREEWRLETRHIGRRVLVFDQLDSTSTFAATLAVDAVNDGVAILADTQTAGRGQHGRSWTSPPGSGVLLSVLLAPPVSVRRPALLTAWAAVSVCEAIRETTGIQAQIKWPNDVLIRGRKVCGILLEQQSGQSAARSATVAGIGLNVRQTAEDFEHAGLPDAGSLLMFAKDVPEVAEMARVLLRHLDEEYDRLVQGQIATLEATWKWRVGLMGRNVTATCVDGIRYGRLLEMAFDGLHLEQPDGELVQLQPERVLHLRLV